MRIQSPIGVFIGLALLAGSARAQVLDDHLECFKTKDTHKKTFYTAQVEGFTPRHGCVVKLPAAMLCLPTPEPDMFPTPPAASPGDAQQAILCYKIRCRKGVLPALVVADQFGARRVKPKRPHLFCTPAGAAVTSTTLQGVGTPTTTIRRAGTTSTTIHTPGGPIITTTTLQGGGGGPHNTTTTTTIPHQAPDCVGVHTACGACGNGACQPTVPDQNNETQLVCAWQTEPHCFGECLSNADCSNDSVCVGSSGNTGTCCNPCF
jgi:hypothetical protein